MPPTRSPLATHPPRTCAPLAAHTTVAASAYTLFPISGKPSSFPPPHLCSCCTTSSGPTQFVVKAKIMSS